jgi:FlaA1/EpsC-like NDP-sugar epimerase
MTNAVEGKAAFSSRLSKWLREQPTFAKAAITMAADFLLLTAIVILAYMVRLSTLDLPDMSVLPLYLIAPVISVVSLAAFGAYHAAVRSHSLSNELRVAISQILVVLFWTVILLAFGTYGFARGVVAIYGAFAILGLIILRRAASWFLQDSSQHMAKAQRTPVIIYGAGREGVSLAEALQRQGRFRPVAFLDTDYTLVDRTVGGLRVYSTENLEKAVRIHEPQEALIAKPGQVRSTRRALVDMLLAQGLRVNTVPDLDDVINGKLGLGSIKPIKLEDLLGRDPVPPDRMLMEKAVKGRNVLVTGAGGSIGSEIVRQVSDYQPQSIVLFEQSEFALFEIHREIEKKRHASSLTFNLVPVLADVLDRAAVRRALLDHDIDVVFHAAAYKHVRMVQDNPHAGIRTNVFGTSLVVDEARRKGVGLFVLISTDKAVRPTSVMGASKRIAEMVVQAAASDKENATTFAIVRFGNVLGSSGSVVPLFREQIEDGGPIQVTDPQATRYFMLIPEAAQLVIQASAMANTGEVFVLDMGEPVNILEMAKAMVELAGMSVRSDTNPAGDIDIEFIGLRDGEKLHEELQIGTAITTTPHPRIMQSREVFLPAPQIAEFLAQLDRDLKKLNPGVVERLFETAHHAD